MEQELRKAKEIINYYRSANECANAQLVLRDLHLEQVTERLHEKEMKKVSAKRGLMATKAARYLTGDEFMEIVRQQELEDLEKAVRKDANKAEKEVSKKRNEWRAEEQKVRKEAQDSAIAEWEKKVEALQRRGVKRMPAKPKIRNLFPRAPTPDHLKSKKRRAEALEDNAEEGYTEAESEDGDSE